MKKAFLNILLLAAPVAAMAQAGAYDLSFGGTGIVKRNFPGDYVMSAGNVLQADGKIVSAGYFSTDIVNGIAMTRHNADGTVDMSFGAGGNVKTPIGIVFSSGTFYINIVNDMALQSDAKILVVGGTLAASGNMGYFVARYKTNGTPDSTFGINGRTITEVSPLASTQATGVTVQPDGKILVCGNASVEGLGVVRYKTNGTLDSSFGANGLSLVEVGHYRSYANDIALQPDGKIVAVGSAGTSSVDAVTVVRLLADGSPDDAFGTHGRVLTSLGTYAAYGAHVAILPSGRIAIAGRSENALYSDLALLLYNTDGSLYKTTIQDINTYNDYPGAIAVQKDGRILVSGYAEGPAFYPPFVARFNPDATMDLTFGTSGKVIVPLLADVATQTGLQVQPDDKIVLTCTAKEGDSSRLAVVRLLQGPELGISVSQLETASLKVFPNPVTESATLSYVLAEASAVSVSLQDMQGRIIASLLQDEAQTAGAHELPFLLPGGLARGTYTIRLHTPAGSATLLLTK